MDKKPADLTVNTAAAPQKPKKKHFLLFLIIFLLFIGFCIFSVIMRLRDPNITLWKMLKFTKPDLIKKTDVLKTRPPKLKLDERVTGKISAKDGGSVKLKSDKGYTYEVVVAPGVRKNDVTINLTPLEEAPFEYPPDPNAPADQNQDQPPADEPPDPGVDVDVDPPEQPPDTPPDPDNPFDDDGDSGIDIYVFPPGFGGPVGTLDTSADANRQAQEILGSLGLGNMAALISPAPEAPKPNDTRTAQPPTAFIIISRNDGRIYIKPPSPVWANNGHASPPDGGGADVPPEGGTTTPDDTNGNKGKDQADQAAANAGGRCSAEFIQAVVNAYGKAGAEGQQQATDRYANLLDECDKEILGYIKRLCQSDKRLLRRQDFVTSRNLLLLTMAGDDKQKELSNLETSCKGNYVISDSGTQPESAGTGVTIAGSINAQVCGYFDDLWKGKTTYILTADGGEHAYDGTTSFRLPVRGGKFTAADTSGSHALSIAGREVGIPLPNFGFGGNFDSKYTIDLVLYPTIKLKYEIPKASADCLEPMVDIPLAPLTK